MFALLGPVCACAPFDLGFKKFQTIFFADLSRANDPQSCYESAEQDWADSSEPVKLLALWGPFCTSAPSDLGLTKLPTLFVPF